MYLREIELRGVQLLLRWVVLVVVPDPICTLKSNRVIPGKTRWFILDKAMEKPPAKNQGAFFMLVIRIGYK
jgi:hypothetical protein